MDIALLFLKFMEILPALKVIFMVYKIGELLTPKLTKFAWFKKKVGHCRYLSQIFIYKSRFTFIAQTVGLLYLY